MAEELKEGPGAFEDSESSFAKDLAYFRATSLTRQVIFGGSW